MSELIESRGLVRHFADEPAVDGVDLVVREGEIHAIVGLNGAGKTTLMRLLLGMLRPDAGRALLLGADAAIADTSTWSRVGCLVEFPFLYPELTTRENLAAAAYLHGMREERIEVAISRAIGMFELDHWAGRRASTLSLGNRQRLGLATGLIHEPLVLILDEPANALDPGGIMLVREIIRSSAERGAAVLVSSHHFDQLARVADDITVMHRGRVVGSLNPSDTDLEQRFFDLVHEVDLSLEQR